MGKLKNGKDAGKAEVTGEMIKNGGEVERARESLAVLLNDVWHRAVINLECVC